MVIPRPLYLQQLIDRMGSNQVKVITGVRRCGKSFLLFNIFKQHLLDTGVDGSHIFEIAFDRYENKQYRKAESFFPLVDGFCSKGAWMHYVFLDEVQLLEDFPEILNSLACRDNVDVYVTGSNARLLSRDIVTEFRGRGDEISMLPLSFSEFMSVYAGDKRDGYRDYSVYGGLPAVILRDSSEMKMDYLDGIFSEIYISDIVERHSVRNVGDLEQLVDVLASNIGALTNPLNISNTFKSNKKSSISPETVEKYIGYLEDSFLIEKAQRFDIKGRKYIGTPMKYYFTDMGLRNSRLGFRQVEQTHIMENIIYNELVYRGFRVDIGSVEVSERDEKGKSRRKNLEIDFVCNKGDVRWYVQSALTVESNEKLEQEQKPLMKTNDSFKKVIVVGDDVETHYDDRGVLIINILDFLLDEESLFR